MKDLDSDGDGSIDFLDFLKIVEKLGSSDDAVRKSISPQTEVAFSTFKRKEVQSKACVVM